MIMIVETIKIALSKLVSSQDHSDDEEIYKNPLDATPPYFPPQLERVVRDTYNILAVGDSVSLFQAILRQEIDRKQYNFYSVLNFQEASAQIQLYPPHLVLVADQCLFHERRLQKGIKELNYQISIFTSNFFNRTFYSFENGNNQIREAIRTTLGAPTLPPVNFDYSILEPEKHSYLEQKTQEMNNLFSEHSQASPKSGYYFHKIGALLFDVQEIFDEKTFEHWIEIESPFYLDQAKQLIKCSQIWQLEEAAKVSPFVLHGLVDSPILARAEALMRINKGEKLNRQKMREIRQKYRNYR